MKTKIYLSLILLLSTITLSAQSRYTGIYKFYDLPQSARIAGLGGNSIAIPDYDINFATVNPSALKDTMSNLFSINTALYLAKIKYGSLTWGYSLKDMGNLGISIQYLNYGSFDRMDDFGYNLGTYRGNDYYFNLIWSKELFKHIHIGAAFKPMASKIDIYKSYGVAFDLGAHFYNPDYNTMVSLVFKNIGKQIRPFYDNHIEYLPYDIQFGISTKLKHAPFRFSFVFHSLDQPSLIYTNNNVSEPNNTNLKPEEIEKDYVHNRLENILRHTIFGFELIPTKSFYLQLGCNFQQRSELKTINKKGLAGISLGIGIRAKKINISYARQQFHLSQASNHISLQTNLYNFFK